MHNGRVSVPVGDLLGPGVRAPDPSLALTLVEPRGQQASGTANYELPDPSGHMRHLTVTRAPGGAIVSVSAVGAAGDSMRVAFNWRDQGDFRLLQGVRVNRYQDARQAVGVTLSVGEYAVQPAPPGSPSSGQAAIAETAYPTGTPVCYVESAAFGAATIAFDAAVAVYERALLTRDPYIIGSAGAGVLVTGTVMVIAANRFINCMLKY
jgi:hypothetical protein